MAVLVRADEVDGGVEVSSKAEDRESRERDGLEKC